MKFAAMILVAAATFGICYAFDKGFVAFFRNKVQHRSGKAVRVSKHYAAAGIILSVLGIATMLGGFGTLFFVCSVIVLLLGIALIVYYMTFGVFYDEDGFVLLRFGKSQKTYRYQDILTQQIFNASGNIIIELSLRDGEALSLSALMENVYPFLDTAFSGWCRQNGKDPEDCPFHQPENSCWFPQE